jgi:hypothetical protein
MRSTCSPQLALWLGCTVAACSAGAPTDIPAGTVRLQLNDSGRIISLTETASGRECLPAGLQPSLLAVNVAGQRLEPVALNAEGEPPRLHLRYANGTEVVMAVTTRPTHATFRLETVAGPVPEKIEWGPYPTTVGKTVGEVIAVARDEAAAIGLQGLTVQVTAAASAQPYGSQLYAWTSEHDGGIRGAAIALFGCPAPDALSAIGAIETAEGLPHPLLDGVWDKISPEANQAYLIADFSEANIAAAVALTRRLGLRYLYHPNPFRTWGHFILDAGRFPGGDAGLRRCADLAREGGVRLGAHTLTAFITSNDPYVTPRPDPRLARLGSSRLAGPVDAGAGEVPVAAREPFLVKQNWGWDKRFALCGEEIIGYAGVSEGPPYRLTGCTRGALGTSVQPHAEGADIGSLATHGYRTFYPGIESGMMDEMTARLVELVNTCGLRQLSFDGVEGLIDYGGWQGDYTRNRFVRQCWDGWQQHVISDASNLLHHTWHAHTRMNWGEPWGKALREGMPEYRFRNQDFFDRNLLPRMLGWFELRAAGGDLEATSLEDIEWMLAKAAGYDSGFAVVSDLSVLDANAEAAACVDAIREWESARHARAFSASQRERLKRPEGDWHLEAAGVAAWRLWPIVLSPALALPAAQAPEPWSIENPFGPQPLRCMLRLAAGSDEIANPTIEVNGTAVPLALTAGPRQALLCRGDGRVCVCDANWRVLATASADLPSLASGANRLRLVVPPEGPAVAGEMRVRFVGAPEPVSGTLP